MAISVLATLQLDSDVSLGVRSAPVYPVEIAIVPPDSVRLVSFIYIPAARGGVLPPLVILLHQAGMDHTAWEGFTSLLNESGFAVLALDQRGYGGSNFDYKMQLDRAQGTFVQGDVQRYPDDVRRMVAEAFRLYGAKIDTTKLAVIGASIGANIGAIYAVSEPRVLFTGLVSPGIDYRGVNITPAIRDLGKRPLLIAVADKDIYSMQSCNLLSDVTPHVLDLHVYKSYFHGNMLVDETPDLVNSLIDNLKRYLLSSTLTTRP